jgi:hypothetical protein
VGSPPCCKIKTVRLLHYDVAGFALPRALPAAITDVLTDDDRVLLTRDNAASLFPRLA